MKVWSGQCLVNCHLKQDGKRKFGEFTVIANNEQSSLLIKHIKSLENFFDRPNSPN